MKIADLMVGNVHQGQVLYCRIATTVMIQDAKSVLIEDESGICELAVYHLRRKKLKRGQFLAILEPFYKQRLDGTVRVQVDDPSDIVVDFDPPCALLQGLSRFLGENNKESDKTPQSEESLESEKIGDKKEDPKIFIDLEAQCNSSSDEETKGSEGEDTPVPSPGADDLAVNLGNLEGEEDTIVIVAKAAPIGMPTICEGDAEDDDDDDEEGMEDDLAEKESATVTRSTGVSSEKYSETLVKTINTDQGAAMNFKAENLEDIVTIPGATEPTVEHIPLLVLAVNRLISNQKLLIEAVFGKKGNHA